MLREGSLRLLAVAVVSGLVGASAMGLVGTPASPPDVGHAAAADLHGVPATHLATGTVRASLDIVAKDIPMAGGAVWHAWTYNGTVPGPMLTVYAGQTLAVTVHNTMNLTHSLHTHLADYDPAVDGSQVNTITGIGTGAMIPPGGTYTYTFHPTRPGVYYYHCHSADGGRMISEHILQGLYGAIEVLSADEPPVKDVALFMAERGFDVSNRSAPYYIMNGMGIPGGEHTLMNIVEQQGLPAAAALLGHVVPALHAQVGVPLRISLVNIGNEVHSFHLHGIDMVSQDMYPGRIPPANVVPLIPGEADRIIITPQKAGLWLYHCHVVSHADMGMIGVLVVDNSTADLPTSAGQAPPPASVANAPTNPSTTAGTPTSTFTVVAGANGDELSFTPQGLTVPAGQDVRIVFRNGGSVAHTFTAPDLGLDTGLVPPGGEVNADFRAPPSGTFTYWCSVPGHKAGGMQGTLTVA